MSPDDLFVDTSGFYAAANTGDPYHADAAAVLSGAQGRRRLVTTNLVIAEAHALFLVRSGRRNAITFLRRALGGNLWIERVTVTDESQTVRLLEQYDDKNFSYTDASSFVVMRRLGIEVAVASDHNFVQFGYRQVLR